MTEPATIDLSDPASADALACLTAYFTEIAARFPQGFDPGPLDQADLAAQRPPNGAFLIARQGGKPIGCVALRPETGAVGEVKRLWVSAEARGAGLASRLMARIEEEARSLGMTALRLDTSAHLPEAVAFYRRHGWAEIPRYNDNPYAHHWFERSLIR
jgi:GNAT superfamily N-acetyltransferase